MPRERWRLTQPVAPQLWLGVPPTTAQIRFLLPDHRAYVGQNGAPLDGSLLSPDCTGSVHLLAHAEDDEFIQHLRAFPSSECLSELFTLDAARAARVFSRPNQVQASERLLRDARRLRDDDDDAGLRRALLNLALYLRAGLYLQEKRLLADVPTAMHAHLRAGISTLFDKSELLFAEHGQAQGLGQEIALLTIAMHAEHRYLAEVERVFRRYVTRPLAPQAAGAAAPGAVLRSLTGLLQMVYNAHLRQQLIIAAQPALMHTLHAFATANRTALEGGAGAHLLRDAARESLRFMQYPQHRSAALRLAKQWLDAGGMTGTGSDLWLAAAETVKHHDVADCSRYGICDLERKLNRAVFGRSYRCGAIRLQAQNMPESRRAGVCARLREQGAAFHRLLPGNGRPAAGNQEKNRLQVSIFADYNNYTKYLPLLFGVENSIAGVYLEGKQTDPDRKMQIVVHEASWQRPALPVWNLAHLHAHALDGRFNLAGGHAAAAGEPTTIWWREGLAMLLGNGRNLAEGGGVPSGQVHRLSEIFDARHFGDGNIAHVRHCGYLALRFLFEHHREDIATLLALLRQGNFAAYRTALSLMGRHYDLEFATWQPHPGDFT
jgi:microbial collagenase